MQTVGLILSIAISSYCPKGFPCFAEYLLILGSPCVFVLSTGTCKHDFMHNERQRTIVCVTGTEKGNVGWH